MPIHIRSRRGVDHKTAQAVVVEARKATTGYPADAFAQYVLAEAEQDAGNFAAASAAADRALKADPKYVPALTYKGRAAMELAKRDRANADWKAVRSWFIRAAKLDPFDAEPLALFYQSFGDAGERPTKDAIDALLFAVELAPQQNALRMTAVHRLLMDNRVPEAKIMFTPLAYNPHAENEWRNKAAELMTAMSSGDSKKAMVALEALNKKAEPPAASSS
jgi:tetratricopeptide (TPR) repeat protein